MARLEPQRVSMFSVSSFTDVESGVEVPLELHRPPSTSSMVSTPAESHVANARLADECMAHLDLLFDRAQEEATFSHSAPVATLSRASQTEEAPAEPAEQCTAATQTEVPGPELQETSVQTEESALHAEAKPAEKTDPPQELLSEKDQEGAWVTRVRRMMDQESQIFGRSKAMSPAAFAKAFEHLRPKRPSLPPLDFRKVSHADSGGYDFSASPARASSEGYLGTTVAGTVGTTTVPGRWSGLPLHLDSPEAKYQAFVRKIRAKHLEPPKESPYLNPLVLAPLKDHFALKKKKTPSLRSSKSEASWEMPIMEQLHSHFHHHFHLRNDHPAMSEAR